VNVAKLTRSIALLASLTLITACGGGGGGSNGSAAVQAAQGSNLDSGCTGSCATSMPANLTQADVGRIIAQAVNEAVGRNVLATIAVTDRVGNVIGLFQMNGAATTFTIQSGLINGSDAGLENINILPSTYAAIAKAITGSYLASEGNAFSTRTASQIIQEHFNPGIFNLPGGPLFGVQFSQLPCGDLVTDGAGTAIGVGPNRSPLGLSADPGGFPLYKNGHPVGGIGVISDGIYSLDLDIGVVNGPGTDANLNDESIAIAGQFGFAPPIDRQADRITVIGNTLRYSDVNADNLIRNPATAPGFATITGGAVGDLVDSDGDNIPATAIFAPRYFDMTGGLLDGSTFGAANSGIRSADAIDNTLFPGLDAFVLTDGAGTNRYPPTAGTAVAGEVPLTAAEVTQLLRSALGVANQARAQIRRPLDSQARVTISVVDAGGAILGIARTRDAPMFGTDVSLQKARTATFFSTPETAMGADDGAGGILLGATAVNAAGYTSSIADYVTAVRAFVGATALSDGIAFADRSGGNLSRPFYPDGIDGTANGPFSKPFADTHVTGQLPVVDANTNQWSPFSNGLQLDLVFNQLVTHLASAANPTNCAQIGSTRLANGIQIFPGSVPIYRNGVLIGGIGVSGDGIEQDDMISFLGTNRASVALGQANGIGSGAILGNAPTAIRADTVPTNANLTQPLRYIQCPQNPFIGSTANNVCDGL